MVLVWAGRNLTAAVQGRLRQNVTDVSSSLKDYFTSDFQFVCTDFEQVNSFGKLARRYFIRISGCTEYGLSGHVEQGYLTNIGQAGFQ
jgi:hypothetical protein